MHDTSVWQTGLPAGVVLSVTLVMGDLGLARRGAVCAPRSIQLGVIASRQFRAGGREASWIAYPLPLQALRPAEDSLLKRVLLSYSSIVRSAVSSKGRAFGFISL